jgi:hypothetical protein
MAVYKKLSELSSASPLTGAEMVELTQGGNSVRSTVGAILSGTSSYSNYSI